MTKEVVELPEGFEFTSKNGQLAVTFKVAAGSGGWGQPREMRDEILTEDELRASHACTRGEREEMLRRLEKEKTRPSASRFPA